MSSIQGRSIKMESNHRCDFCHRVIPVGKYGTQVAEGKAQGMFHGARCYGAALEHYEKLEREEGIDDTNEIEE